jgi:putative endopeptidase
MKRSLVVALLLAGNVALAQDKPDSPEPEPSRPERPITALPYTPSLDVTAMDPSADPCVDFYQYTCGGWIAHNPIPPDQASWSVYGKLAQDNEQFLWGILEDAGKPSPARTPVQQKIGDYFHACMDETAVDALGGKPLEPLLQRIAALKSRSELAAHLAREHPATGGSGMLFEFGSAQDFSDATQVIAFAGAGGLGLPDRDYYTKEDAKSQEIRAEYRKHVTRMLVLAGEPKEAAAKDAGTVLEMETALAKASLTRVERRDPYKLFHKMSPAELKKLTPAFEWKRYLDDSGLAGVETVNVMEPGFFREVDHELRSASLAEWKAYLRWHVVHARAPYLSKAFVAENFDFYAHTLRGVAEQPPRWKRCVRYVDRDLGEALGQEFVRRTFSARTKQDVVEMTRRIESAMEGEIETLDWMSEPTRQRALEKLHAVANKVGYPDRWRDYTSVEVRPTDFFGNVERATIFESRRELGKIGKPVDRGEWDMTPPTVNAYYNPQLNDMNFPAGVLQPPLYDPKLDAAPNYGNTGSTIGHELTHGFDDEGRQFDAHGNLKDWWSPADAKAFEERIQCVRDQYAQYTIVDDIKINSKLTSGEDVADIGGTLLAYLGWKAATAGEALQPGDGFTPDQRFFIGFAQWACENERPENLRANAITNPHSPGKYRVNGVVANLPQFQQAFACRGGQPMVSGRPCKVW